MLPTACASVAISILILACNRGTATTTATRPVEPTEVMPTIAPPPPADARPCAGAPLEDPVTVIVEGTSVRLSGQEVVADAFMMRWIERDTGASEHVASARVSTADASTSVRVGTDVPIGSDRYCVVTIDYGYSGPSSLSVQKLVP